ncbi:class III lanthionine synthetase LanKC [Actinacidiphila sp. DG2A-62]|uniref:class III lanthionine synthetase LanKC n=1 Tax=Actinacidiphila sp. DG2A-62 TaxID=3108821 RepID=UPI002DBA0E65|nr:class III lanthionine synthetase LanKC [Actinacidiphila sp. DG2A-62]MEC3992722.1 class III lanthionine synthetase LanKC [Actinacidiphila sp. DG2A-62]
MIEQTYAMADPDYYAPVETLADRGRVYAPSKVPPGWHSADRHLWRSWGRQNATLPDQGWKVHVSARAERIPAVLDVVAEECFGRDIAFKHVVAERFVLLLQHKHASRTQSGKLIVAYPPDERAAGALMSALAARLESEQGQFILTDRRYGDSRVVHYRYGSFTPRRRLLPDGTGTPVLRDGRGRLVADRREPRFHLPEGITDPFAAGAAPAAPGTSFHGFAFERALRHSNGGGAYAAREIATGRKVFVKEARDHTGLSWDGLTAVERARREWEILRTLHRAHPGICPEPIAYFREWEHEFLVTEFVEGVTLTSWVAAHSPVTRVEAGPLECERYTADCEAIIASLEGQLRSLHASGYLFGDVSPGNVLVGEGARPRLVDFEAARGLHERAVSVATDGYAPSAGLVGDDPTVHDLYGVSALVRLMLGPTFAVADRCPHSLDHLRADLQDRMAVPAALWERAVRYHPADGPAPLPGPGEVAADPERHVRGLRDEVARALTAMADPERADTLFPTVPDGYASNTVCVAYGSAGVLHALRHGGVAVDERVVARFRRDALAAAESRPPGLHVGLAGIAWVLADHGRLDEARDLLAAATAHPLTAGRAGFGEGAAGVAMTHLSLFGHTGDERHVETAERLLSALPEDDAELAALLDRDDPTGWLHGRCGIAWALLPLAAVTGDARHLRRGVRLLHRELDRATPGASGSPHFPASAKDRRSMPYLFCGTAGMLRTVARYTRACGDERLASVEGDLLPRLRTTYTVMPGLYQGLAGLGFALADHAGVSGDQASARSALRTARALFKYAVPGDTGVRFHGERLKRFSADLWSGGAGILLFLDQVLDAGDDRLFSLDRLSARLGASVGVGVGAGANTGAARGPGRARIG